MQNRAADQWVLSGKNIRRHNEMGLDLLALVEFKDKGQADKVREKYHGEAERYTKEQAEIEEQAKEFENESARAQRKADRYDLGEVFFEIALVITSLSLLTRNRFFWLLGILGGVAGLGIAVTGHLLR
jgi:hypothetical protein